MAEHMDERVLYIAARAFECLYHYALIHDFFTIAWKIWKLESRN